MSEVHIHPKVAAGAVFVTNVNGNDEVTKAAAKKKKNGTDSDSTSTATKPEKNTKPVGVDASTPVLNPNNLTDAQMVELIAGALTDANKQRHITQDTQKKLNTQSVTQTETVTVNTDDTNTQSQSQTSGKTAVKSKASTTEDSTPSTITITNVANKAYAALTSTLSDALLQRLDKQLEKKLPHKTWNKVQNFLNSMVDKAQFSLILPALNSLGTVGKTNFRTDVAGVKAAAAVQFGVQIQKAIEDGDVKKFSQKIFPDDKRAATQFAAIMESVLISGSNVQAGKALNLPGLANQVNAQAGVLRGQQTTIQLNTTQVVDHTVQGLIRDGIIAADQKSATEAKLSQILLDTTNQGPYNTREDLLVALEANISKQYPDDKHFTNLLANALDRGSFEITAEGQTIFVPNFAADQVNSAKTQDSIKLAILSAFAKSQEQVNAASKAKSITDDVLSNDRLSRYKSESDIRDAIRSSVLDQLGEADVTKEQADAIASGADFGIQADPNNPLNNPNSATIIAPWSYRSAVEEGYQRTTHTSPRSDFGEDINQLAGAARGHSGHSSIELLNASYAVADRGGRNFLHLTADEAADLIHEDMTDPGAVVKNLGEYLNSPHLPSNFQQARFV